MVGQATMNSTTPQKVQNRLGELASKEQWGSQNFVADVAEWGRPTSICGAMTLLS